MKKKIPKWLKYAHSLFPNDVFFQQLNEQAPPLFEAIFNKKINWQRAWLFIEPVDDKYIFHYSLDAPLYKNENRELVLMKCRLGSVEGNIGWYNASGLETISIHDDIGDRKLKFQLFHFELRPEMFRLVPGIEDVRPKHVLTSIRDFNVYYEVIEHEGYVAIHFKDIPGTETIDRIGQKLAEGRNLWNTGAGEGFLHNLYFSKMEDENVALYTYDHGSAQDGVFAFILNKLGDEDFGIEKVEIIGV